MGTLTKIYTNEKKESVYALEHLGLLLKQLSKDPYYWKWAILAIHNCFHNFMVATLMNTHGLLVQENKSNNNNIWMNIFYSCNEEDDEDFDFFLGLYDKLKGPHMDQTMESKRLITKKRQDESIYKLHTLHNQLIVYTPWNCELNPLELPIIFIDCLDIIRFLAFESNNIYWSEFMPEHRCRSALEYCEKKINYFKF